jgi:hypothetical protein
MISSKEVVKESSLNTKSTYNDPYPSNAPAEASASSNTAIAEEPIPEAAFRGEVEDEGAKADGMIRPIPASIASRRHVCTRFLTLLRPPHMDV